MELTTRLAQTKSRIDEKLEEIDRVMKQKDKMELQSGESLKLDDQHY